MSSSNKHAPQGNESGGSHTPAGNRHSANSSTPSQPRNRAHANSATIFGKEHRGLTLALIVLITVAAFDQTAVMAVMPSITSSLGSTGGAGYTLSFTAVTAASIVAMVVGGLVADSRGALRTLRFSSLIFIFGLILAVFATTMPIFLISRVIQGLGSGAVIVAIYAIIALAYPPRLQTRMFSAFAGAWVLPTLVGPGIAGVITEQLSWHWIFAISAAAGLGALFLLPRPSKPLTRTTEEDSAGVKVAAAVALAVGIIPLSISADYAAMGVAFFTVGLIVIGFAIRPLVPSGTFRAQQGLPSIIFLRFLFDAFFGLEALIPLLLAERNHLPPTLTGIVLTGTGVSWFVGSYIQSNVKSLSFNRTVMISAAILCISSAGVALSTALPVSWVWIVVWWTMVGLGVGYSYPRINAVALNLAPEGKEGFAGSALQVAGMTGMTMSISAGTLIYHLSGLGVSGGFAAVYAIACILPLVMGYVSLTVRTSESQS